MAEVLDVTSMLPTRFEPKRKNRFILALEGIDAYIVKSSGQPTYNVEEVEIPWMNTQRYIAGKAKPNVLPITFHDPIAPSGAQQVHEWFRTCFDPVSGRAGYADFYKRDAQLKLLDPIGTVVSLWDIKGGWLQGDINPGDLSYEDATLTEISVNMRWDLAVLQY